MKKINILLLIFLCTVSYSLTAQAKNNEGLINSFLCALSNETISSEQIARNFIYYKKIPKDSIEIKIEVISKYIQRARKDINNEEKNWVLMNPEISNLKKKEIHKYYEYSNLNEVNLNIPETEKNNVYVLLNSTKSKILQYFLIKEEKIYSFNLFKQGNSAWFYIYN